MDFVLPELLSARSVLVRKQRSSLSWTTDFFVRPWEIYGNGRTIEVQGQVKTYQEVRRQLYENIVDEALFVSRASEGAVSAEWIMAQPIFIRKKYVESFTRELKDREKKLAMKTRS